MTLIEWQSKESWAQEEPREARERIAESCSVAEHQRSKVASFQHAALRVAGTPAPHLVSIDQALAVCEVWLCDCLFYMEL